VSVQSAFQAAGVSAATAKREAPLAEAAMLEFDITTRPRAAAFLAQVLHESGGLRYFEEIASGAAYEGRRDLGNTQPGDGRRFKGRGPIQLTGRANYAWASKALDIDLIANPQRAAEHEIGWRIAGLYWKSRGLNELADQGDFQQITRRINGGYNGDTDRRRLHAIVRRVDCRPADPLAGYTAAEIRWIREFDKLRREGRDERRQGVLRIVMRAQRKRIWKVAQPKAQGGDGRGWKYANRAARYRSLKARTT
jgi:predicted chitinase